MWRSTWKLTKASTIHSIEYGATKIALGHAPLAVSLKTTQDLPSKTLTVVVVHMPPANHAELRNQELRALMKFYPLATAMRTDPEFDKGTHIIAGDFNIHPEDVSVLARGTSAWTSMLPRKVSTMVNGSNPNDNFLINRHTSRIYHATASVKRLNRAMYSDHHPISLLLTPLARDGSGQR